MRLDINKNADRLDDLKFYYKKNKILTPENYDLIFRFISDMEKGENTGGIKGKRTAGTLVKLLTKLINIAKTLQSKGLNNLTNLNDDDTLFKDYIQLRLSRNIKVGTEIKVFASFWHWYIRVKEEEFRKLKKEIQISKNLSDEEKDKQLEQLEKQKYKFIIDDITKDLNKKIDEVPCFVYFSKKQVEQLVKAKRIINKLTEQEDYEFSEDEQIIILIVFDTLIRTPTELASLQRKHIQERDGYLWIDIPSDIDKNKIGRSINVILYDEVFKKWLDKKNFKPEDRVFIFSNYLNDKIKRVSVKLFGDVVSHSKALGKFSNSRLYDLRHSGAIYFRKLANDNGKISLDTLLLRGGWSNMKMLNYYTRFIDVNGKIKKDDLTSDLDKSHYEKEIESLRAEMKDFKDIVLMMKELTKKKHEFYIEEKDDKIKIVPVKYDYVPKDWGEDIKDN